jgi:DNA-binding MarR family transcriptional regulator
MANLHVTAKADFIQIMNDTGLSRGNLSSHISKLQEVGYIAVKKSFTGKAPRTELALTRKGREALREYRRTMEPLIAALPQ